MKLLCLLTLGFITIIYCHPEDRHIDEQRMVCHNIQVQLGIIEDYAFKLDNEISFAIKQCRQYLSKLDDRYIQAIGEPRIGNTLDKLEFYLKEKKHMRDALVKPKS